MESKYNDLIGEILERSGQKDNFDVKGKGKPLSKDYLQMDTFQHFQKIAKDAGFLPPWLKLQKEISRLVHTCQTEKDVKEINKKIKQHNKLCPLQLQKGLVSIDNLDKAKEIW